MAKRKNGTPQDTASLTDEVAEMEALVKRKKKLQALLAEDEGDDIDPEGTPLPGSELIEQVMTELGGDGSFSIVKLEGGKTMDMGTHDLTLWPDAMEELVKVQGGGNYVLIFRRPDGTIAKRIKRTYPASLYPAPAKEASSGSGDMLAMLKIMEDRDARREAQNETLRLEAMKGQQSMMTAMMAMMGAQNKPMVNNAAELATIAKLFGAGEKKDSLSDLVALKDLLDDLRGDQDDEPMKIQTDNPFVAMLAPVIAALVPKIGSRRLDPAHANPTLAAPTPVPAVPATPPPAASIPAPVAGSLAEFVPSFKAAIEGGVSPADAAEFAWNAAVSKGSQSNLSDILETADWRTLLTDPYLKEHSQWLTDFRVRIEGLAFEPEPPASEPAQGADAIG